MGLFGQGKKVEYKVLKEGTQKRLQKKVEKHLSQGWRLEGGITVNGGFLMSGKTYYQSVVREKK